MPDLYQTVSLDAVTTYPATPQVTLVNMFVPDEWAFRNLSVDAVMFISFDGTNDHARLDPNEPNEAVTIRKHIQKVWCRRLNAAFTAPADLMVTANTDV